MPSHVLNVESSAAATLESTSESTTPSPSRSTRRKVTTRIAAVALAGAAAVSLSACGTSGGGAGSRAVAIAAAQAGEPYVYGATGPNSFDCSGFTQYVYRQMGIDIPRTASGQAAAASIIPKSSARPGDLIFIGSPAYHVGIYAGNGQFWTAPKPGDVVKLQSIWSSSYYVGRF